MLYRVKTRKDENMDYSNIVKFHGHSCPGLAIGYRMASEGLKTLESVRAMDEELVSIVENDACGVDALQCLTGCTFGKGNLIFHDFGKSVYTMYSRISRKGIRILFHGKNMPEGIRDDPKAYEDWILNAPTEDMLSIEQVYIDEPEPARIKQSIICAICKESVMETRTRNLNGNIICIPCSKKEL